MSEKSSFVGCFFWGLGVKRSQFSKKARPWKSSENHGGLVKNRLSHGSLLGKRSSKNQQNSSSMEVAKISKKIEKSGQNRWKNGSPPKIGFRDPFWSIFGGFWVHFGLQNGWKIEKNRGRFLGRKRVAKKGVKNRVLDGPAPTESRTLGSQGSSED